MQPILFLDLDGVFVDFYAWERAHIPNADAKSRAEIYAVIEKVPNFFLNLKPFNFARINFQQILLESIYEVKILTSMPQPTGLLHTTEADKKAWVKRELGDIETICVPSWDIKKYYNHGKDILVDDMQRNCDDWRAMGGLAVCHKTHGRTWTALKELGILKTPYYRNVK